MGGISARAVGAEFEKQHDADGQQQSGPEGRHGAPDELGHVEHPLDLAGHDHRLGIGGALVRLRPLQALLEEVQAAERVDLAVDQSLGVGQGRQYGELPLPAGDGRLERGCGGDLSAGLGERLLLLRVGDLPSPAWA
jgi:hypothetical protein